MATDPSLHDDIAKLAGEIHELSDKFSAKEVLAQKAKELADEAADIARRYRRLLIAVGVGLIAVIAVVVWLSVVASANRELANCQARFNKANELRSSLLTEYAKDQRAAMKSLVEARGLPNDEKIIEARDAWLFSNWMVDEANRLNPVPKYSDFCKNVPGVDPPKVPPANVPDPTMYPGPPRLLAQYSRT